MSDNAQLMAEWDWEKNIEFDPKQLTLGSHKKVWWKCNNGHEWQAAISDRNNGNKCPYCSGKRVLKGYNDLQTVNPKLIEEWNYEKNGDKKPEHYTANSHKKVWWICKNGHEWQSTIASRSLGRGCPYCSGRYAIKGKNDLQSVNLALASEWNYEKNGELTPENILSNSHSKVWWRCTKGHEWCATVYSRNCGKGCPICASERKSSFPEYVLLYYLEKYGLEAVHSHREFGYELDIYIPSRKIAIEYDGYFWHKNKMNQDIEKNKKCKTDGIKLFRIREGLMSINDSSIDYIIKKNQEDLPIIVEKILSDILKIQVVVDIKSDFIDIENHREHTKKSRSILYLRPEIAKEWNYEKNKNLKPENFTAYSKKKVWWVCKEKHEWQATIANRFKGSGCPYCSGRKVLNGVNDLETVNPILTKEWNYDKNGDLKPNNFTVNSHKIVWWRCSSGHEWQARIADRNRDRGCPECAKQKRKKKDI